MIPSQRLARQTSKWKIVPADNEESPADVKDPIDPHTHTHTHTHGPHHNHINDRRHSRVHTDTHNERRNSKFLQNLKGETVSARRGSLLRQTSLINDRKMHILNYHGDAIQQERLEQLDNMKVAGDSFELDELFDLNSPTFWRDWERAGGDPDEYFKETLPNYGLVATLFMTISIPATLEPPSFGFNGQGEAKKDDFYVSLYVVLMCVTTVMSLISVLLTIGIHQQYVNSYSKALRVDFAAKYGYLVGVLTTLLCMDAVALFGAMACAMLSMFEPTAAAVGLFVMLVGGIGALVFYANMTAWNANNYSKQMVIDIRKLDKEEAESKMDSKVSSPTKSPHHSMSGRKLSVFSMSRQNSGLDSVLETSHRNGSGQPDLAKAKSNPSFDTGEVRDPPLLSPYRSPSFLLATTSEAIKAENDLAMTAINRKPVEYGHYDYQTHVDDYVPSE